MLGESVHGSQPLLRAGEAGQKFIAGGTKLSSLAFVVMVLHLLAIATYHGYTIGVSYKTYGSSVVR